MNKTLILICLAAALVMGTAAVKADDDDKTKTTAVAQLEDDIKYHDEVVEDSQDSIAALDERIAILKQRLDSLNLEEKNIKEQISALEKEKKNFKNEIKAATKARQVTYATRDNLVFDKQVQEVLINPYNKLDVENAMRLAENMETKDVLSKMELVKNYGRYTKDLRDFMDKQRSTFAKLNWATQGVDSDVVKNFMKSLKKQEYYKIYDKGLKNVKNATIPYLDKVIEEILVLQRQGFNSKYQYDKVVDMLYGVE